MENLAFIFTRHITEKHHNDLWKLCVINIRKVYKEVPIIIIDDNSNEELVDDFNNKEFMRNVSIIKSEFKGAGELLPYYYFHKNKYAKKAIIIHDSMFVKKKFDEDLINNLEDFRFLWYFATHRNVDDNERNNDNILFYSLLNNSEELYDYYNSYDWLGCFGCSTIINLNFLETIQEKYNIFNIITYVNTKRKREILERLLSVVFTYEIRNKYESRKNLVLFGCIHDYPNAFYYLYHHYKYSPLDLPVVKCWFGR